MTGSRHATPPAAARPSGRPTAPPSADLTRTFRAMATDVTLRVVAPTATAENAVDRAEQVFHDVERACTRFEPTSPLMRANARPRGWHDVPPELYDAVAAAHQAYEETGGLFDPRVLEVLRSWGYDRSLPFRDGPVSLAAPAAAGAGRPHRTAHPWARGTRTPPAPGRRPWRPAFDAARRAVRLGGSPIDLGGIGKGLAVRWASLALAGAGAATLVEAGGDVQTTGPGPEGTGWRIAVEDPRGGPDPVAVLGVEDAACATSSVRLRQWRVGGRPVHHLVDPRTGEPGGRGLLAVTVVGPDPARAEVWSKALFLAGRGRVRSLADERGLAVLLVDEDGVVGTSRGMKEHLLWQAPRGW